MSFSVSIIGKPDAIKRELAKESERLSGQSKVEFDAVRPALENVLDQNVGNVVLSLHANGHASFTGDMKTSGSCSVDVKTLGQIAE